MITEALGIRGWGRTLDRMILTSIITGDPLLMLSNYGQGKTALVDRFGQVLLNKLREERPDEEMIIAVVNAATANPQDWAGYFVPKFDGEKKGDVKMELLESPLSLINAVLIAIDEISRAAARNQNNILSLVQERRVDGIPTKCEILFAMMNPVIGDDADEGSEPLIGALADRFALLIEPPSYSDMNSASKKEVTGSAYKPTSSMSIFTDPKDKKLGKDAYEVSQSVCDDIWEFLAQTKKLYNTYCFDKKQESTAGSVVEYVCAISSTLSDNKEAKYYISGRRSGMLSRAVLANYAIGSVLGDPDMSVAGHQVIMHSIMNKAMGRTHNPQSLEAAHNVHARMLAYGPSPMTAIMAEPNKWKRLKMAFKVKLKPDEFTRLYKEYIEGFAPEAYAEIITGMAMIDVLPDKMSKHELSLIASKIIEITASPVRSVALDMSSASSVSASIVIARKKDMHSNRIMAICVHLNSIGRGPVTELWGSVNQVYLKALEIIKED